MLSQEDLAEITQQNQAAIERKLEIDLSKPSSKPPQFAPPAGKIFFFKFIYLTYFFNFKKALNLIKNFPPSFHANPKVNIIVESKEV